MQFKNDFEFNGNDYISVDRLQQSIYSALHNEALNYEVEIIEEKEDKEEKKIPEKLDISGGISVVNCAYKINEIIDYLDYLKSKGDE
jgi:hypothetical protein